SMRQVLAPDIGAGRGIITVIRGEIGDARRPDGSDVASMIVSRAGPILPQEVVVIVDRQRTAFQEALDQVDRRKSRARKDQPLLHEREQAAMNLARQGPATAVVVD